MVGRNDPCPCGSGKKYKKFCMEQQQVVSLASVRYDRIYEDLLTQLEKFCRKRDKDEIAWAEYEFFGPQDHAEGDEEAEEYAFLDWFAFGYPDSNTGRPLVSLFAQQRRDPAERELLAAWEQTRPGFYRVLGSEGQQYRLIDVHTGAELTVDFRPGPPGRPGSVLCGRLLPTGPIWRPSFELLSLPSEVPAALEPLLDAERPAADSPHPCQPIRWPDVAPRGRPARLGRRCEPRERLCRPRGHPASRDAERPAALVGCG